MQGIVRIKGGLRKQAVIRAVCAIIDAFHFPLAATDDGTSTAVQPEPDPEAEEIQAALIKRILPALQAQLVQPCSATLI